MKLNKHIKIALSLAAAIFLLVGLSQAIHALPVQANEGIFYVSSTDPACGGQSPCYITIQAAVDAASDGDLIKIATGVYTDVLTYAGITQVLYLNKGLTIRGGYTTSDWITTVPDAHPATLDAQGLGRGLVISGFFSATVEGLHITGGDAAGLGGGDPLGSDAGGGVFVSGAKATISNCEVYSNTASSAATGYGGGLYALQGDVTMSGNTIISNTASSKDSGRGGGVYLADSTARLSDNTLRGNTAATANWGDGGGLYLWKSSATLISNLVLGNTASRASMGAGGGLFMWDSTATLLDNTVQGNTASTASSGSSTRENVLASEATFCGMIVVQGEGGGLSIIGSSAKLSGNTVISNTASTTVGGAGGGVSLVSSSATLIGNTVQGNTATTAAGAYSGGLGGGVEFRFSNATLINNTVENNTASSASIGDGGGVHSTSSRATLTGNLVRGNKASATDCGMGGGLALRDSDAVLSNNQITGNVTTLNPSAIGRGGGLRIGWGSSITLTNNIVAGNQANSEGSGLWLEGESDNPTAGYLRYTTIADNNGGSGQGVYVGDYTTLVFSDTIIAGHDNAGITVTSGSIARLEATLWCHNGSDTGGGGVVTSRANVYGNPAFVNPAAWNYHISPGSAAIDQGVEAGVSYDIDSDIRPADGDGDGSAVVDIGADEFVWKYVYLPLVVHNY